MSELCVFIFGYLCKYTTNRMYVFQNKHINLFYRFLQKQIYAKKIYRAFVRSVFVFRRFCTQRAQEKIEKTNRHQNGKNYGRCFGKFDKRIRRRAGFDASGG